MEIVTDEQYRESVRIREQLESALEELVRSPVVHPQLFELQKASLEGALRSMKEDQDRWIGLTKA